MKEVRLAMWRLYVFGCLWLTYFVGLLVGFFLVCISSDIALPVLIGAAGAKLLSVIWLTVLPVSSLVSADQNQRGESI